MPSLSRRAVLAMAGALPLTGCTGVNPLSGPRRSTTTSPLSGTTIYVGDSLRVPGAKDVRTTSLDGVDVAVVPATSTSHDVLRTAVSKGIPAAIVGRDAPKYAQQVCAESGRQYALPGQGWTAEARVSGLVPTDRGVEVQRFLHTNVPADLPWTLRELLDGTPRSPSIPLERAGTGQSLGRARIRGQTEYGGFDRWDVARRLASDRVAVTTTATIWGGGHAGGQQPGFDADRVRIVQGFDGPIRSTTPTGPTETDDVEGTTSVRRDPDSVTYSFVPHSRPARSAFTVRTRTVVGPIPRGETVSLTENVRFRWRDAGLLRDRTRVQHTPGTPIWSPGLG